MPCCRTHGLDGKPDKTSLKESFFQGFSASTEVTFFRKKGRPHFDKDTKRTGCLRYAKSSGRTTNLGGERTIGERPHEILDSEVTVTVQHILKGAPRGRVVNLQQQPAAVAVGLGGGTVTDWGPHTMCDLGGGRRTEGCWFLTG